MVRTRVMVATLAIGLVVWLLPNPERARAADPCGLNRKAVTMGQVEVHPDVPRFTTGKGWVGPRQVVTTLPKGTSILICEERWVGFIGWQKRWLRIRFGEGQEGWIFGEETVRSVGEGPAFFRGTGSFPWPLEAAAQGGAGTPDAGIPSAWPFYLLVFSAVCLGMAAKALYDLLEHGDLSLRRYCYRTVRSLLVAPIVLQGLLQYGDLGVQGNASLLALLGMAFQNGFFWQTVLVKAGDSRSR